MVKKVNIEKFVRYDGEQLFLRRDGEVICLGIITTRKGGLTRAEKLQAVARKNEWIKI